MQFESLSTNATLSTHSKLSFAQLTGTHVKARYRGSTTHDARANIIEQAKKQPHMAFDIPKVVYNPRDRTIAPPAIVNFDNPGACSAAVGAVVQMVSIFFEGEDKKNEAETNVVISEAELQQLFEEAFDAIVPQGAKAQWEFFAESREGEAKTKRVVLNLNPHLNDMNDSEGDE